MADNNTPPQKKRPAPAPAQRPVQAKQGARPQASGPARSGSARPEDANNSALASVITRNDYYRDQYRNLVKIAVFEAIAILGLIAAMIVQISVNQTQYRYFATTIDGRQVPMVPISQPNLSKPALLSWAAQAATEVMTFGFNDYRRRLQEASRNFTPKGWVSFSEALYRADIVEAVRTNRQAISAAPASAPVLIKEGVINGRYEWVVQLPLNITTSYGSGSKAEVWNLRLKIVRVSVLESPNGVGIEQWLAMGG